MRWPLTSSASGDLLAGALPCTVLQLVQSKYVLGLMATLSTVLLAIAVWLAKMLLNVAQQSFIELMVYIAAGLVVNLLLQGISLPLYCALARSVAAC